MSEEIAIFEMPDTEGPKAGNGAYRPGPIAELSELRERIFRIESFIKEEATSIAEAGSWISVEVQRVDEIKLSFAATVETLEKQLGEKDEDVRHREAALAAQEEDFNAKVRELTDQIADKEERLIGVNAEIQGLHEIRQGLEATVEKMGAQVREKDELLHNQESHLKELTENMTERIRGLEEQAGEKEAMVETAVEEVRKLQEIRQGLEGQLRQREELLQKKDSALRGLEESLTAKIRELEGRVNGLFRDVEAKMGEEGATDGWMLAESRSNGHE